MKQCEAMFRNAKGRKHVLTISGFHLLQVERVDSKPRHCKFANESHFSFYEGVIITFEKFPCGDL